MRIMSTTPIVRCVIASMLSTTELADIEAFVLAGGEVAGRGLMRRIKSSFRVCDVHIGKCLVAVAGLKNPEVGYRARVSRHSKIALASDDYAFELGWVFVLPRARGKKLSRLVCEPLARAAGHNGIFATSYVENDYMHHTLERLGFVRAGADWKSSRSDRRLCLFTRDIAREQSCS